MLVALTISASPRHSKSPITVRRPAARRRHAPSIVDRVIFVGPSRIILMAANRTLTGHEMRP